MPVTSWNLRIPMDPDYLWEIKQRAAALRLTLQDYVLMLVEQDLEVSRHEKDR